MLEKSIEKTKLKFGMLKEYNGIENNRLEWSFSSYIIFYEKDGYNINLFDEKERYPVKQNKKEGEIFLSEVSDSIDIVMYKVLNPSERKSYFLSEIEDAVLASEFYFKEKEKIIEKREQIEKEKKSGALRLFKKRR